MPETITITLMMTALSPITHMGGTEGNEAVLMRMPLFDAGARQSVPVLTGNALRHRAIREAGFRWLIDACELRGKLTLAQGNFLLNGGAVTRSTRDQDTRAASDGFALMPLFRVLGGCLPGQIEPGRLSVGHGVLCCRETIDTVSRLMPGWVEDTPTLRASDDFVAPYQYTRGSSSRDPVLANSDGESGLMIFSGEQVTAGSVFASRWILRSTGDLDTGALLHALSIWDGTIGGQSSRGHGRMDVQYHVEGLTGDAGELIDAYKQHTLDHKEGIAKWISDNIA